MKADLAPLPAAARISRIALEGGSVLYRVPASGLNRDFLSGVQQERAATGLLACLPECMARAVFASDDDQTVTLQRRFELLAQTNPGAIAVSCGGAKVTYGELDAQADGLAVLLQQRGIGPGRVCAICMHPSVALTRAVLAVLKAGGASLVLDPDQQPARQNELLLASEAVLLLRDASAPGCPRVAAAELLCTEDGADLPYAWPLEHPTHRLTPAYALMPAAPGAEPARASATAACRFSSHLAMLERLLAIQELSPLRHGDAILQNTEYGSGTLPWDVMWPLSHGAKLVIPTPQENGDPQLLRLLLQREPVAVMHIAPPLRALLESDGAHPALQVLRAVFYEPEPTQPLHAVTRADGAFRSST